MDDFNLECIFIDENVIFFVDKNTGEPIACQE